MRAFVKLRKFLSAHKVLAENLSQLEKKWIIKTRKFSFFEAIKQSMTELQKPKGKIGFYA